MCWMNCEAGYKHNSYEFSDLGYADNYKYEGVRFKYLYKRKCVYHNRTFNHRLYKIKLVD